MIGAVCRYVRRLVDAWQAPFDEQADTDQAWLVDQEAAREAWDAQTAEGLAMAAAEAARRFGRAVPSSEPVGGSELFLPWRAVDLGDTPSTRRCGFTWGVEDDWGIVIGRFDTEHQARAVVAAVNKTQKT